MGLILRYLYGVYKLYLEDGDIADRNKKESPKKAFATQRAVRVHSILDHNVLVLC